MSSSSKVSIEQKRYLSPRQNFYRRVLRRKRKHYVCRKRKRKDRNRCSKDGLWRRLIEMIIKIILLLLSIVGRHIFIS